MARDSAVMMKAVVLTETGSVDGFVPGVFTRPVPTEGQLLVKVAAAALNPVDYKMGVHNFLIQRLPCVLGCDYSGTIEAVGSGVGAGAGFKVGDAVFGYNALGEPGHGTFAQYLVAEPDMVFHKPRRLTFEQAASVPVAFQTASLALFNRMGLSTPDKAGGDGSAVLIWGGSTSVGQAAVQLAVAAGYTVLATASPANFGLLRSLGASHVFDYHDGEAVDKIRAATGGKLRFAMDCAGGAEHAARCLGTAVGGSAADAEADAHASTGAGASGDATGVHLAFIAGAPSAVADHVRLHSVSLGAAPGIPADRAWLQETFAGIVQPMLARGALRTQELFVLTGVEGIADGIRLLSQGGVSGKKLVGAVDADIRAARITAALVAAQATDAAVMPLHWIYDQAKVAELAGSGGVFFHDPPCSPFYTVPLGDNTPFGKEMAALMAYLATEDTDAGGGATFLPDRFAAAFAAFMTKATGYTNGPTRKVIENVAEGKAYPYTGADDQQSNGMLKGLVMGALFAGDCNMPVRVECCIRVHQHNDVAVKFGVAAARVIERVIVGASTPLQALEWLLTDEAGLDAEMRLMTEVALARGADPDADLVAFTADAGLSCWAPSSYQTFIAAARRAAAVGEPIGAGGGSSDPLSATTAGKGAAAASTDVAATLAAPDGDTAVVRCVRTAILMGGEQAVRASMGAALFAAHDGVDSVPDEWLAKWTRARDIASMVGLLASEHIEHNAGGCGHSYRLPVYAVLGASGGVGSATVRHLSTTLGGRGATVVAGAPDPASAAAQALKGLPGVRLVRADPTKPETLAAALKGAHFVFAALPGEVSADERKAAAVHAIQACRTAGTVEHIVGLTATHAAAAAATPDRVYSSAFNAAAEAVRGSGRRHTIIAVPPFLDSVLRHVESVQSSGTIVSSHDPDATFSHVVAEDVGRAVAQVLMNSGRHAGCTYTVCSPETWSMDTLADELGFALNTDVAYVRVAPEETRDGMVAAGVSEHDALAELEEASAVNGGHVVVDTADVDDYERITGHKATTVAQWIRGVGVPAFGGRRQTGADEPPSGIRDATAFRDGALARTMYGDPPVAVVSALCELNAAVARCVELGDAGGLGAMLRDDVEVGAHKGKADALAAFADMSAALGKARLTHSSTTVRKLACGTYHTHAFRVALLPQRTAAATAAAAAAAAPPMGVAVAGVAEVNTTWVLDPRLADGPTRGWLLRRVVVEHVVDGAEALAAAATAEAPTRGTPSTGAASATSTIATPSATRAATSPSGAATLSGGDRAAIENAAVLLLKQYERQNSAEYGALVTDDYVVDIPAVGVHTEGRDAAVAFVDAAKAGAAAAPGMHSLTDVTIEPVAATGAGLRDDDTRTVLLRGRLVEWDRAHGSPVSVADVRFTMRQARGRWLTARYAADVLGGARRTATSVGAAAIAGASAGAGEAVGEPTVRQAPNDSLLDDFGDATAAAGEVVAPEARFALVNNLNQVLKHFERGEAEEYGGFVTDDVVVDVPAFGVRTEGKGAAMELVSNACGMVPPHCVDSVSTRVRADGRVEAHAYLHELRRDSGLPHAHAELVTVWEQGAARHGSKPWRMAVYRVNVEFIAHDHVGDHVEGGDNLDSAASRHIHGGGDEDGGDGRGALVAPEPPADGAPAARPQRHKRQAPSAREQRVREFVLSDDTVPASASADRVEGTLVKRGQKWHTWHARHAVLDSGRLTYLKLKGDASPLGAVEIAAGSKVSVVDHLHKGRRCFVLSGAGRRQLMAHGETDADTDVWVAALKAHISKADAGAVAASAGVTDA